MQTMNPLIQFKKIPILPLLIALALVVGALTAMPALATPPVGVTTEILGAGTFEELDVSAKTGEWKARIDTKGESDLVVVRVTFQPGGHTGWHSHPGLSLLMVMSGTVTEYEGDDPSCAPLVHPAGTTFVDPGNTVHLVKNESTTDQAVMVAVALIPAGAPRRIDAPNPGNCPF
jgi:quercetin dioxygenase-like cupin family protein